jgi:exodeoxyribonuclease III
MRCYSWNVNGIRAVARKSSLPWDVLAGADVIALQETKAQEHQLEPELAAPAGWHAAWHSAVKPGYSSVAILSRQAPDELRHGLGDAQFDVEGRVLAARFGSLWVVSAYFPNSQEAGKRIDYKLGFCAAIEAFTTTLRQGGRGVCLLGDYNIAHQPIDLARPRENEGNPGYLPAERAWFGRWLAQGWQDPFRAAHPDLVGAYTWWTAWGGARARNVGWRIDYATVTPDLAARVRGTAIHPDIHGSDHCPVSIDL